LAWSRPSGGFVGRHAAIAYMTDNQFSIVSIAENLPKAEKRQKK
jgi:hypothetical protein